MGGQDFPDEATSLEKSVLAILSSSSSRFATIEITRRGGLRYCAVNHNSQSFIQFRPLACIRAAWNHRSRPEILRIVLVKSLKFHVYSIRRDASLRVLSRACLDKMESDFRCVRNPLAPSRITRGYCYSEPTAILINTEGILRNIGRHHRIIPSGG